MTGHSIPPVPDPKPDLDEEQGGQDKTGDVLEAAPVCGTYEVGQIRISSFDILSTQPSAVAPGVMQVTAVEFSYVPNNPDDKCLEIHVEEFSTGNGDGRQTVHVSNLGLLLQSDMTYWNTKDADDAFKVAPHFEMSAKLKAEDDCQSLAPGRLYVRFHCSGEDGA